MLRTDGGRGRFPRAAWTSISSAGTARRPPWRPSSQCFAEASGRDLSAFFAWYEQAGTPTRRVESRYDEAAAALDLTFTQSTAPTPGQTREAAAAHPGRPGPPRRGRPRACAKPRSSSLEGAARQLSDSRWIERRPVLSALRGFSAPVNLVTDAPARTPMSCWPPIRTCSTAGRRARSWPGTSFSRRAAGPPDEVGEERFAEAMGRALDDQSAEPAFKALLLALPSETDLAVIAAPADPAAIHAARESSATRMAVHLGDAAAPPPRRRCRSRRLLARRRGRRPPRPCATPRWSCWRPIRTPLNRELAPRSLPRRRQHDRRDRRP